MQVPACDFAGYVRAMVDELYAPLVAAIDGQLTGPGTLGTVALCECLLTLLSSWQITDQPYKMFRAYKILPLSNLQVTRKVDLSRYATLQGGVMYITEPVVQRVWIPFGTMTSTCRVRAQKVLEFLSKLQAGRNSGDAVVKAAKVIVQQFLFDMGEMGIVADQHVFEGRLRHGCIREAVTAEEYVGKVFVPERLSSRMSTKAFLSMALQLFSPSALLSKVTKELLEAANIVPEATVHDGRVNLSTSFRVVLVDGPACAETVTRQDAHRLVIASTGALPPQASRDEGSPGEPAPTKWVCGGGDQNCTGKDWYSPTPAAGGCLHGNVPGAPGGAAVVDTKLPVLVPYTQPQQVRQEEGFGGNRHQDVDRRPEKAGTSSA